MTKQLHEIKVAGTGFPERIMSGDYSQEMWDDINNATSVQDLQDALYFVCCRLQELEEKMMKLTSKGE